MANGRAQHGLLALVLASSTSACVGQMDADEEVESVELGIHRSPRSPALGGHLAGISDEDFEAAREQFAEVEDVEDGVGPIFNEQSCGTCHSLGAVGGAGEQIERRFGRFDRGRFNPLANEGGSLRQLFTLGSFVNEDGETCDVPLEVEPADATVRNVGRLTTPLFGLGLVDAMPDEFFFELARHEPFWTRGVVNVVDVALPNPDDRAQRLGHKRVGRFGWKANIPTLAQFAADAYFNEMGITTQHCIRGESVETFATESAPNGVPVAEGCDDGIPGTDLAVGSCAGGRSELEEDVADFTTFMTFLAPPPRDPRAARDAFLGELVFAKIGCDDCHTQRTFVTPDHPTNGVPGRFRFQPYSDFLLHDMGSLGDFIGNAGDSVARTRLMRTAPLWGLRFRNKLLHDGRTTDLATAIRAHDGQAAFARRRFERLSRGERFELLEFLRSL